MSAASLSDENRLVTIRRWLDVDREHLRDQLDAIFFESSNTKDFASEAARAAFRERWLGRYLTLYPQWAYLACDPNGDLAGYLVGAIGESNGLAEFAAVGAEFPAHLHVNLAPRFRGAGIGRDLIETFAADAVAAGAAGVHVVTSAGARNVRFYERAGFAPRASAMVSGRELLFLGRRLPS